MFAPRKPTATPNDLTILNNGMAFVDGRDELDHLWFEVIEREDGQEYHLFRVVRIKMLRYLPQESRQDAGLLDTMRAALTGLYNQRTANYEPCMLVAGIFGDNPLGVVQCYGAIGIGPDRTAAERNANRGMAAVEGVMANFPQSRLDPLDAAKADWLRRAFLEMNHSAVVIGQPDPRQSARGMGREGAGEKSVTMTGETAYTMQQNEMLFRALSRLEEEFLFQVVASRVEPRDLAMMLEGVAAEASVPASRQTGSKSISFGISLPLMASGNLGQSIGSNYGTSEGQSVSDGVGESESVSHTEGHATTVGRTVTDGTSHTEGHATTSGSSVSNSVSVVEGFSQGTADSVGSADSTGSADSVGHSTSVGSTSTHSSSTTNVPAVTSTGGAQNHGFSVAFMSGSSQADTTGTTDSNTSSQGTGLSWAGSNTVGRTSSVGGSVGITAGVAKAESATQHVGASEQSGTAHTEGTQASNTEGTQRAITAQMTNGTSSSWSHTPAHSITSHSSSHSTSRAVSHSTGHTDSQSHSESQGHTTSQGTSRSVATTTATSSFGSSTHSASDTTSHSESRSWSSSDSVSDGTSHGTSRSHTSGRSSATSIGRAVGLARSLGMSAGVVPSVSASKSYQWFDDKAIQITAILRAQEELLRQATLEGAWLTDAYLLCRTERGAAAGEAALRQAFHGSELPVVTPVQTRRLTDEEKEYIRLHALAFTPSTREETVDGALEAYKDSTMLLPLQLAAYVAPGLFEEGTAVTTQERIPAFAYVPDMPGDVILGHLWSTETGRLTRAQLRLSEDRMFHTAFAADTGFGKTVAAERLAVETTRLWGYRTVVLDFGAGWRRLLNAPLGEPGRVEVHQVFPGASVPFRWNPLQIGKRVNPERQMTATCELVRNAGQMGPRQVGYMRRALKKLYLEHGVLTSYREVLAHPVWSTVQGDEWDVVNAARAEWDLDPRPSESVHLRDLETFERQALAVHRSRHVDIAAWYTELLRIQSEIKNTSSPDFVSLEGILLRMEPFVEGEMYRMYGQGGNRIAVEDLGSLGPSDDPWGISILEGGAEMDEFAKAVIFSLVAWHLYNDAVVRRRLAIGHGPQPRLQIFFEEANKVLGGVSGVGGDDRGGASGDQVSDLWLQMWRDGRKYGIWLHPVAQTISELPAGILSSCNNAFYSQTKNPHDRDQVMAHLAFSEKGFTDEDYKRFLSRMPLAMAVCKLGYSMDVMHTTPFLCRPVRIPGEEPTDRELLNHHLQIKTTRTQKENGSDRRKAAAQASVVSWA